MQKLFKSVKVSSDDPLFSFDKNKFHTKFSLIRLLDSCVFNAGLSHTAAFLYHFQKKNSALRFYFYVIDVNMTMRIVKFIFSNMMAHFRKIYFNIFSI